MHLILTSADFGNERSKKCIIDNLRKPIRQCKVLFFPNEKATEEMILSEKYYNPKKFANLKLDCIHVSGGNTCQTLDRIRKCNADKRITDYVNQGVHILEVVREHI